jgi:hypothetical protein
MIDHSTVALMIISHIVLSISIGKLSWLAAPQDGDKFSKLGLENRRFSIFPLPGCKPCTK